MCIRDRAVGRLRIRRGGSAGGHNGLKNISRHLGTDQFPRLRVGWGEKPHPDYDMADWVLGKFQGEDKKAIDQAVKRAADAVECILAEGIDLSLIHIWASAHELMTASGYVDLLIPRGGAGLIRACVDNATVPVIETGTGICHVYVDRAADLDMALDILENAKCSRPSVCNAAEV